MIYHFNNLSLPYKVSSVDLILYQGTDYSCSYTRKNDAYFCHEHCYYKNLKRISPLKGNCSIFPLSGVAAETNFTISCENWIDVDAPLSYEFSFHVNGVKLVLFHRMIRSGQAISVTDWLGIGDESNDYKLNVSVQVEDFFGAKSLQVMTVQVSNHFFQRVHI